MSYKVLVRTGAACLFAWLLWSSNATAALMSADAIQDAARELDSPSPGRPLRPNSIVARRTPIPLRLFAEELQDASRPPTGIVADSDFWALSALFILDERAAADVRALTESAPLTAPRAALTPVPLPAALWLLGSSAAGLAAWRRGMRQFRGAAAG